MTKIRQSMRDRLEEARGPVQDPPVTSEPMRPQGPRARLRAALLRRRIRTHLFSGIEFEMTVFIIGPLTGRVIAMSVLAGTLLAAFELLLIVKLWRATHGFPVALAKAEATAGMRAAKPPARRETLDDELELSDL
jgi:hypothetical protein